MRIFRESFISLFAHGGRDKRLAVSRRRFQIMHFQLKLNNFDSNVTDVCSWGSKYNKPALVQIIAWCRTGEEPLSLAMTLRVYGRNEFYTKLKLMNCKSTKTVINTSTPFFHESLILSYFLQIHDCSIITWEYIYSNVEKHVCYHCKMSCKIVTVCGYEIVIKSPLLFVCTLWIK